MINLKKFCFINEYIVYFEFVISFDGLKMDSEKAKEIHEWPTSKNVTELR